MKVSLTLLIFAALMGLPGLAASDAPANAASPVLVELFTSEGCSSCPPADALLGKLDGMQLAGTQLIVLSEHVDYWDHDGWKDAYSSHLFTERQEQYESRFGLHSAFTPQIVVNGAAQMSGNDGPSVGRAIESARGQLKIPLQISSVAVASAKTLRMHLVVSALPGDFKGRKADIFVVVALDHAESRVSAGENKGRDIRHVAVVESMEKVGAVEKERNFDREVVVKVKSAEDLSKLRLVAFVQQPDTGDVVGATMVSGEKMSQASIKSAAATFPNDNQ